MSNECSITRNGNVIITRNENIIILTDEEIEQIYRYQEKKYHIADAKRHVTERALEYTNKNDKDPWCIDIAELSYNDLLPDLKAAQKEIFNKLISFDDDDYEYLADCFQSKFDCNCDENTLWNLIIDDYVYED